MRRLILEDPFSRAAIWSRTLAVFALLVALIGIGLARKGLDPSAALAIEGAAMGLAVFAILFAFVAMAVIWRTGFRGTGIALAGLVLAALILAYPAYLAVQARKVPLVADVSTDIDDPPTFLTTNKAVVARQGVTPAATMRAADRSLQARLYPDLQPLMLDTEAADVDDTVHKLLKRRHWMIADETRPANFATGHIDVVVKSAVMGFPADLTIRIRQIGGKTQVDVRSVARGGWQEPGSNAARVLGLIADLDAINDES